MLNVNQFYEFYGIRPNDLEHLEINGYQVMARENKVYVMTTTPHEEPFMWLAQNLDGVVFYTRSGLLSAMLLFDSELDETEQALSVCNRLINVVQ